MATVVNLRTERKTGETAPNRARGGDQPACSRPSQDGTKPGARSARQRAQEPRPTPDRDGRWAMKSPVVKRSIVIAGHKTSVSLEDVFWKGLKDIAIVRQITLSDLVASIDTDRQHGIYHRRCGCSCS